MTKKLTAFIVLFTLAFHTSLFALPVTNFEGKRSTLEQQLAPHKWSLVVFWSVDCMICRAEVPALSALHQKYKDTDLKVVGVSIDGLQKKAFAQGFMAQTQMSFPSVLAELAEVADSYQELAGEAFRGTPSFLLFNPKGELMGAQAGALKAEAVEAFIKANS